MTARLSPKRMAAARTAGILADIISRTHDAPTLKQILMRADLSYGTFASWQKKENSPNLTSIIAVLDALDCMLVIIEKPSGDVSRTPLTPADKRP